VNTTHLAKKNTASVNASISLQTLALNQHHFADAAKSTIARFAPTT